MLNTDFEVLYYRNFSLSDEDIPNSSGLYCWYFDFDSLPSVRNEDDFIHNLGLINDLLTAESLEGNLKSSFRQFNLNAVEDRAFLNEFSNRGNSDYQSLFRILCQTQFLNTPLYIGISKNLRTRFNQHMMDFNNARDFIEELGGYESFISVKEEYKNSFGYRIAANGFKKDNLIFCYKELMVERSIVKDAETIINKLYSPKFGIK